MTKPLDPYSRVYWRVLDDERFDTIRADMRHFGSWTLMLVVADMAYPAPAFIPSTIPKVSRVALSSCGLIELLPGGLYRVHGLKKEREERAAAGRIGADAKYGRTPTAVPSVSERTPNEVPDETSIDKTRKDEHLAGARAGGAPRGGPMKSFGEIALETGGTVAAFVRKP